MNFRLLHATNYYKFIKLSNYVVQLITSSSDEERFGSRNIF